MGRIEVEVGRASLGPSQLEHAVSAVLGQVGRQVDAQSTKFGQMLTHVRILPDAVLQPRLGLEPLLLTLKTGAGFTCT